MIYTRKHNNGGFSLVELIVVIAIGVILASAVGISISSVLGVSVKQCARNIESVLNKTKVSTMGKDSVKVEIYKNDIAGGDDAYYYRLYVNGNVSETKKIGRSSLEISYSMEQDYSAKQTLAGSDKISIEFNRSSGSQKTNDDGKCCSRIWIKKGGTEKVITIYKETGKVVCE